MYVGAEEEAGTGGVWMQTVLTYRWNLSALLSE
jgi:hypothetical protein